MDDIEANDAMQPARLEIRKKLPDVVMQFPSNTRAFDPVQPPRPVDEDDAKRALSSDQLAFDTGLILT
jgi:hypothetical protein